MKASDNSNSHHNLVVSTLLVAVLALSASLLLLLSFVIWFAEIIDSLTIALLSSGVALALAAWATYKIALSPTLQRLRKEHAELQAAVKILRDTYNNVVQRAIGWIRLLLNSRDSI